MRRPANNNYKVAQQPSLRMIHGKTRVRRHGSVLTMMAFLFPVFAILSAFCINAAYMQLTRAELMVATDAAARAGGRALSELQSVEAAKNAAVATAALNKVNGQPLLIRSTDASNEIEFGITVQNNGSNGRFEFQKIPTNQLLGNSLLASSVRISGLRTAESLSGRVPMIIPGLMSINNFAPTHQAVAMQVDRDISLVIDRSGSMEFLTIQFPPNKSPYYTSTMNAAVSAGLLTRWGNNYYYNTGVSSGYYEQWVYQTYYRLGTPPNTPWQDLKLAVNGFLSVLNTTPQNEQVSLASYADNGTLNLHLVTNYATVTSTLNNITPIGGTAIGFGMQSGIQALLAASARPYAAKTMVVMTDGVHNVGTSPVTVANSLMSQYNLTIHTVTFGEGANQALMLNVANIGGGKHYHAANGAQLVDVFEEIANNLPTILTQ